MEIRPILRAMLRNKTGPILVALQVMLSLGILVNAVYVINDRHEISTRSSGLSDESSIFYMAARDLADESPEQLLFDIKRRADILRAIGGVVSVAQVDQMPMSRSGGVTSVVLDPRQEKVTTYASVYHSGDSLIDTFGLVLEEGRNFLPKEISDVNENTQKIVPQSVIISRSLAERLWHGISPLGKTLYFSTGGGAQGARVIGVVGQLITANAEATALGFQSIIFPQRLYGNPGAMFAVRTEAGQRDRVMKEAEVALRQSSTMPMLMARNTVDNDRKNRYQDDATLQWSLVAVSVLLILITCCGIAGMASLWVTQRTKQIGVRRALGARRVDILRYFLTENLMITTAGIVGGIMLGLGLNTFMVQSLEMARLPASYLILGALAFWLVGICSACGPAIRAARVSPAIATK